MENERDRWRVHAGRSYMFTSSGIQCCHHRVAGKPLKPRGEILHPVRPENPLNAAGKNTSGCCQSLESPAARPRERAPKRATLARAGLNEKNYSLMKAKGRSSLCPDRAPIQTRRGADPIPSAVNRSRCQHRR